MSTNRIFGLVLLAIGVMLLLFGYNASQSLGERIFEGFTGRFTNQTMWFLVGGAAAIVGGAALSLWGGRRGATK